MTCVEQAECGPGWLPLLATLDDFLRTAPVEVIRVETRLGVLRVTYTAHGLRSAHWRTMVDFVERASSRICERCGAAGRLRVKGLWEKTLCDQHAT